jgi:hypothetical protein
MLTHFAKLLVVCLLAAAPLAASGVTLDQLRKDTKLTPQRFAAYFAGFTYQFRAEVQDPATFLATESGDCDDYATLAASVLAEKGFTTRLITVQMAGENHVVCFVEEFQCYLDYNNRACLLRTVASDGSLTDIARKVANSFDARWAAAAEFTYDRGSKQFLAVAHPDRFTLAPPTLLAAGPRRRILVDF